MLNRSRQSELLESREAKFSLASSGNYRSVFLEMAVLGMSKYIEHYMLCVQWSESKASSAQVKFLEAAHLFTAVQ